MNATSVWDVNSVHGAFKQQFQGQPHTDFPHASADHRKDASDAQVRAAADDRVRFMEHARPTGQIRQPRDVRGGGRCSEDIGNAYLNSL